MDGAPKAWTGKKGYPEGVNERSTLTGWLQNLGSKSAQETPIKTGYGSGKRKMRAGMKRRIVKMRRRIPMDSYGVKAEDSELEK